MMVEKIKNLIDRLRTRWEINIVLTNTLLHLIVGTAFGLSGFPINLFACGLLVFIPIAFLMITISFELAQKERVSRWNWIDSTVDVLAGNIGFNLVYWIIWLLFFR